MDFKGIESRFYPAYAWLWNNTITRDGIDRQIDEMQKNGIKAFYVIGEPDTWFPDTRATKLSPKYLSDEYLDLLFYAFQKAKANGMYTWLYNEGAFPSGCACGLVTEKYPELVYKYISVKVFSLQKGEKYTACKNAIAAFIGEKRITDGYVLTEDSEVREYFCNSNGTHRLSIRVDNAERRGSEEFIKITHERMKQKFEDFMGSDVHYMFDDESYMGGWSKDFDKIFFQKYGYDITDFAPYISNTEAPTTNEQYRAVSDYIMLCGDLIRENYFVLMRDWLRKTNMQSVGHLDNDDKVQGAYIMRYGNMLKTMRAFDVPGIDVIWEQISYPKDGKCCKESMEFFPRLAPSAARQIGKNVALSESFAVYGSHVTPDLMRFVVNYQAVRGINLFNFMAISNDRETPMRHQFRPNFLGDNVLVDCIKPINDYTARLSFIMQSGKSQVKTALYYPFRTICAGGEKGKNAGQRFVDLGEMLESKGVSFDFIDEDFVLSARCENGVLIGEHVSYENVFVANGDFETPEVLEKLSSIKSEICPDIKRKSAFLQSRKIAFEDKSEGYFIFNQSDSLLEETVEIATDKNVYKIDLFTGDVHSVAHNKTQNGVAVDVSLVRGEGIFLWLANDPQAADPEPDWEYSCELTEFKSCISRVYRLDYEKSVVNTYPAPDWQSGFVEWDEGLSGEATYICRLPKLENGDYRLNLGEVRHCAKVYLNGEMIAESTMYPYTVKLDGIKGGEELKIIVANTPANECARSDYFERHLLKDVGPYHKRMVVSERDEGKGGLFGPVILEVRK